MWDKVKLVVIAVLVAVVLVAIVYKLIFGPRKLKKGDKAPVLKMPGRPEVRVWVVLWLDKVRRDDKSIHDDTPISQEEVRQGLICAVVQYQTSLTCADNEKIKTVADMVELLESQLPKPAKKPESAAK